MNNQPDQPERTDEEVPATSPRPAGRLPGQWYSEADDGTPVASEPAMAAQGIPIAAGLTPRSGEPTTGFSAHDGEVIVSPRVFAIYWGRDYGSPATGMNALATSLDSFIAMLLGSRYFDMMGEYLVGRGTFIGSTWIDHSPNISKTYTQDDIRDLLIHWIDDGVTPEVPSWDDREHVFLIFPPTEITLTLFGDTNFCGYHYWGHYHNSPLQKDNLFFGVLTPPGRSDAVAHELAEICTDRSYNGWYTRVGIGAEIGDVCSSCGGPVLTLGGFPVASYWLVSRGRCLQQEDLTPPPPPADLVVTISPPQLPLDVPTTFTISTVDSQTGQPVAGAHVTIRNFSRHTLPRSGGNPVPPIELPSIGSPQTATVTFHSGRSVDPITHDVEYDKAPSLSITAPGYTGVTVVPDFPDL
jgi:hypothetical protein